MLLALAHVGVSDVGQVGDLGALADRRALHLDERADLAPAADPGSGTQVGERADHGAPRRPRPRSGRSAATPARSPKVTSFMVTWGPMSQPSPIFVAPSRVAPAPMRVSSPMVTPACSSMVSGATKVTPFSACWATSFRRARRLDVHQVRAVVDALRDVGVGGAAGGHSPLGREGRDGAGEVELAVLLVDLLQRGEQLRGLEDVGAEVDLADGQHLLGQALGALGLDDALEDPVLAPHRRARSPPGRGSRW